MCRVLQVARSGFYKWLHKPLSDRAIEDQRLLGLIRDSYTISGGVYGAPRVFGDLREAGESCGKHRVARIMRRHKIKAIRGYKAPRPIAGRPSIIAPNRLNREFTVDAPDRAWVTDITYIRTWQGWLYLAVVMDLHARKIVGWSMKPTLARELVLDALLMAVWRRKPQHRVARALRPRHPIRQRRLGAVLSREQPRAQHESTRQLLGQCGRRILLQQPEERARSQTHLQNP